MSSSFPTPITHMSGVLNKRHISKEKADLLSLAAISAKDAFPYLGYVPPGNIAFCEALPYFDADGHPLGEPHFHRFRVNYTPGWIPPEGNWFNYPKYRGPKRKGEYAYLTKGLIDWSAVCGNPDEPIIITEGEYKAIRVCDAWKKPCVGLGGVWMFNARREDWPEGFDFKLPGRTVYIVYDADKESTQDHPLKGGSRGVEGAAKRLSVKLYGNGAVPVLLYIARTETFTKARQADPNAKMGLDDYIDAGGTWEELRVQYSDPVQQAGLAYLMDTYAMYRGSKPGVFHVKKGILYSTKEFYDVEANCKGEIEITQGGKDIKKVVKLAPLWLDNDDRPEFYDFIFEPSLISGLDQAASTYNKWNGFKVAGWVGPGEGDRYKEVVATWRKFTMRLCGGEGPHAEFEKWVADIFQNPGRKTTKAVLLRCSLMGVGKSLLGEVIRDIVGTDHSARLGLRDVTHHFNSLMASRVLVQVDEARDIQKEHDSQLNHMVTAEECVMTLKNRDSVIVKSYGRLFLTSNDLVPINMDEHNRRWLVLEPDLTIEDQDGNWSKWVGSVVAPMLRSEEGLRMLRFHLDQIDLAGWNPTEKVMMTEAAERMIDFSRSRTNDLTTNLLRAFLEDETGVWVTTPRLHGGPQSLSWKRFSDAVIVRGGSTPGHPMKLPGEGLKRVRLYVRKGAKGLAVKHVKDQGVTVDLAACGWDNKWLLDRIKSTEKAWVEAGGDLLTGASTGGGKF